MGPRGPAGLADLVDHGRFQECREKAEALLRRSELPPAERGEAFLALSRCLVGLHEVQSAIGPGELAVYFARTAEAYDLLGLALAHLSSVYADNRLHKRSGACLEEYFFHISLFKTAGRLEGGVLHRMGLNYQSLGRQTTALEYLWKAYHWHTAHRSGAAELDQCRADLIWVSLKAGNLEPAERLLAESERYLRESPNDLEARARYGNNVACRLFLVGQHKRALEEAMRVVPLSGVSPLRKAQAYLLLHHATKALGASRQAVGLGVLAKIHAHLARRPDLDEEASRSLLHLQHETVLPPVDELFRAVRLLAGSR